MQPISRLFKCAALALFLSMTCHQIAFAQGSLTPPGAPGPTMKSLDQIEPRTPISFLPFTITTPGSYYLTTNLTGVANQNGISISTNNVTIDLNGFTLSGGGGGSGEAIWSPTAQQNLIVRNGTVRNWPGSGINFYDGGSSLTIVQNIQSISNGFTGFAIKNGSRVTDCIATGNGLRGFIVDNDCLVEHCKAAGSALFGIGAGSNCQLLNNQSIGNTNGLSITGTNNIVAGNIVRLNMANYSLAQGNQLDLLLCQVPETISWPAKVKLAGSMSVTSGNAITINASGVTVDLNGFTISSTENPAGTSAAIFLGTVTNVTILNGIISSGVVNNAGTYSGKGFGYGIFTGTGATSNVRVSGISVSGCQNVGIALGDDDSLVESCTVTTMGASGISATVVSNSKVKDCGIIGILAETANNCYAENCVSDAINVNVANNCEGGSSGDGDGITSESANNCIGSSNMGAGVSSSVANNCRGSSLSGTGLEANTANDCYGSSNDSYGINAGTTMGCAGTSINGIGLAAYNAAFCTGSSSGTAIRATIANGCIANGGTNSVTYKYNMP